VITAYIGLPRSGKTYSLTAWLLAERRRGRLCLSQYAVDQCRKLSRITDLLDDTVIGAAVALDEVGRILPARDWTHEDDLESAVFELHGHRGLEIRYAAQSWHQVSAQLRRLTGEYVLCTRVGPDPTDKLLVGEKLGYWDRPRAVKQWWYQRSQIQEATGEPYAGERCIYFRRLHWVAEVANAYDTRERLLTESLEAEAAKRLVGAPERLAAEWTVDEGRAGGEIHRLLRARDNTSIPAAAVAGQTRTPWGRGYRRRRRSAP
jgi:hypothetical protein